MNSLPFEKIAVFYGRLAKREKILFFGTMLVLGLFLSDRLLIRSMVGTFRSLQQESQDLQAQIKRSMRMLSEKDRITKQLEQYASYTAKTESGEDEMVVLLKHIEELAVRSEVNLLYVKPAGEKTEGRTKKYLVTLESESQLAQLVSFFYELENSILLLQIEKYSIEPTAKSTSLIKCVATLSRAVVS